MKRKFDWAAFCRGYVRGTLQAIAVAAIAGMLWLLFGCTPVCKPNLPTQRTDVRAP